MRWIVLVLVVSACSPSLSIKKGLREIQTLQQDHVGFSLYDPAAKKSLVQYNDAHYFTPASNTKIFTFYASLKLLKDSIGAINYIQRHDSLIFWGLGDPSFLNPLTFDNGRTFQFLKSSPYKLFFASSNFKTDALGNGWSWDDYNYNYSIERSPFALYGNLITILKQNEKITTQPLFFEEHLVKANEVHREEEVIRSIDDNQLTYYPGHQKMKVQKIPFHFSSDLVADLLSDTLKRQVEVIQRPFEKGTMLKSIPVDSALRVMMQDSDNFIAEQLLLQCATVVSDTLQPEIAIRYAIKNLLSNLPDKPQWVDGSGLSRFNLFTPRSIVHLWEKILLEIPRERLFKLLAVGGKSGTIQNWYKQEPPFIYAKTGTLSNTHCLSGFLITKKGKMLIFSWMNNNFVAPTNDVRRKMEKLLTKVRNSY
jgi:serine-type D-Ala-D-Ala carboxypeptidase/endopeptidase (penicillin-binding protein 4)